MIRSADAPARLGPAGEQLMLFAATSALQVSCASRARGVGVANEPLSVGVGISEQAASVAAERITALRRFSMTSRDEGEKERGRTTPTQCSGEDRAAVDRRADRRLQRQILQTRQIVDLRRDPALSGCPGR